MRQMALYANIIIDISHEKLDKTFQYKVPGILQDVLEVGQQVEVPFGNGNRMNTGYVVELTDMPSNAGNGATKVNLTIVKSDSTYQIEYALLAGINEVDMSTVSNQYKIFVDQ